MIDRYAYKLYDMIQHTYAYILYIYMCTTHMNFTYTDCVHTCTCLFLNKWYSFLIWHHVSFSYSTCMINRVHMCTHIVTCIHIHTYTHTSTPSSNLHHSSLATMTLRSCSFPHIMNRLSYTSIFWCTGNFVVWISSLSRPLLMKFRSIFTQFLIYPHICWILFFC